MALKKGRVQELRKNLARLGPMLPGSISQQWNVCGKPGCRCKDPVDPKKHGPYHQLSYTVAGRSSTVFLRPEQVPEVRRAIKCYAQYKELTRDLLLGYVEQLREFGELKTKAKEDC